MTPDYKFLADIFQKVEEVDGFDGSDQQRQLLSLLMPVNAPSSSRGSVQSSGRLKDEYTVGELELGTGATTKVMNCVNLVTRRMFAVKTIFTKPILLLSPNHRKFTHEIAIMERLVNHPNVIDIKKAFFDNNTISIVMDFAQKSSLHSYIPHRLHYDPELDIELNNKQIISQICKGMAYVHAQGIVHCDLKPQNILVITNKPLVVKVADFGIAQVVGSSGFLTSSAGTIEYMAPERGNPTEANGGFNDRADSWSVGAIAFGMLTGRDHLKPIPEELRARPILSEIISGHQIDWDAFDEMRHLISTDGEDFIQHLLEPMSAERWSMAEAAEHQWLQNLETVQQPTPMPVGSGSDSILRNNSGDGNTKKTDTDCHTGTGCTQLVEDSTTPSVKSLRGRSLPPIEEEADLEAIATGEQGDPHAHQKPVKPATSNTQNVCNSSGTSKSHSEDVNGNGLACGKELHPARGNPPHSEADVAVLPASSWITMRGKRAKGSQKPPTSLRKSPRSSGNGENVRATRRSARLQALNQTGQSIRYSPY